MTCCSVQALLSTTAVEYDSMMEALAFCFKAESDDQLRVPTIKILSDAASKKQKVAVDRNGCGSFFWSR